MLTPMKYVMLRSHTLPIEITQTIYSSPDQRAGLLHRLAKDPFVRLALLIASPSLSDRMVQLSEDIKQDTRLTRKFTNFLVRMSSRPTPFGLLAGIAVCEWGNKTDVLISNIDRTRTRLDMEWVITFIHSLESTPEIAEQLHWTSNSAIWCHGGRATLSDIKDARSTVSIACTRPVQIILSVTRSPVPYVEVRDAVLKEVRSATPQKVDKCFQEMRKLGLVYSDLTPPITSNADPIGWLLSHLPDGVAAFQEKQRLISVRSRIQKCDEGPAADRLVTVQQLANELSKSGERSKQMPLQVDLMLDLRGETIHTSVGEEAAKAAQLLITTSGFPAGWRASVRYYNSFVAKYGAEREVPFLELANPEWGLGLTPLNQFETGAENGANAYLREQVLHELVQKSLRAGKTAVELDDDIVGALSSGSSSHEGWPTSLELNVFVLAKSAEAIDQGNYQLVVGPNIGAMKAGRHFARFADMLNPTLQGWLKEPHILDHRRDPLADAVELTFMPTDTRLANVSLRLPVLDVELNYGVSGGRPLSHTLRFDDLIVGAENGQLYVKSLSLGRQLRVSSNSMLNPTRAPRECQILLALASDEGAQLSMFRWGSAGNGVFLPRLTAGRTILNAAQWRLRPSVAVGDEKIFRNCLNEWRKQWMCPRFVYLCAGDNRLLQDMDDQDQVDELRRMLRKGEEAVLQEPVPNFDSAWLPGPRGLHVVELVVPLKLKKISAPEQPRVVRPVDTGKRELIYLQRSLRVKPPGSDWIFLKLYGPRSQEDNLIRGSLAEFCSKVNDLADWYFLRYSDPRSHLRVRFRTRVAGDNGELIAAISAWATNLIQQERCQEFSFDTYDRELERYGGVEVISDIKSAFCADSSVATKLLVRLGPPDRVVLGVFIVDRLLEFLGLTQAQKIMWCKKYIELQPADGAIFRAKRAELFETLTKPPKGRSLELILILQHLKTPLAKVASSIARAELSGVLTQPADAIYRSVIYMHCNRVWGLDNSHELEILRILRRSSERIAFLASSKPDILLMGGGL